MMTHTSSVALYWRLQKQKYGLTGTKCSTCGTAYFPPKSFCPDCRRKGKIEPAQFSGKGKISSYTIIRVPPEGFEKYTPYAMAIIELDEGTRISGQIVGNIENVATGKRVETVFRRISEDGESGLIHYGLKWRLVD
jgi:uncharacterized OB-fold protein